MKIIAVAPNSKKSGATFYSRKLYSRLPARLVSTESSLRRLFQELFRSDGDIYHIQFEYRVFGNFSRSISILVGLTALLGMKRPVVVTFHGVMTRESLSNRKLGMAIYLVFLASVKLTGVFARSIIVHSRQMQSVLRDNYRVTKVTVIPHGTDPPVRTGEYPANTSEIVFFGFVRPSKGIENVISAIKEVRRVYPEVRLTVAGTTSRENEAYCLKNLQAKVFEAGLSDNVNFVTRFLSGEDRGRLASHAAAIVLPYIDQFVEVSGVVHDVAYAPIVCSNTPRFSELVDGFDCIKVNPTPSDIAAALIALLGNPELRQKLASNIERRTHDSSWDVVAKMHLEFYATLLKSKR